MSKFPTFFSMHCLSYCIQWNSFLTTFCPLFILFFRSGNPNKDSSTIPWEKNIILSPLTSIVIKDLVPEFEGWKYNNQNEKKKPNKLIYIRSGREMNCHGRENKFPHHSPCKVAHFRWTEFMENFTASGSFQLFIIHTNS